MIEDGNEKRLKTDSFQSPGSSNQNLNPVQSQSSQRSEPEKNFMEMEGRVFSDLFRNSSEELLLKSLMESSIGMMAPTMETLGFKNLSQTLRVDSQELFNSWLANGENHSNNSTGIAHCTRHASRRISTELAAVSNQRHGTSFQNRGGNDNFFQQNLGLSDEISSDQNQRSLRNAVEKGMQASNMYLAKAWFQSTQPMTRSRSSELRRRYAAMQNIQTSSGMEAMHNASGQAINRTKQEFSTTSGFCDVSMGEMSNQLWTLMSPSNPSGSSFNSARMNPVDAVSSVVSMLKGSLERKKLSHHVEKEAVGSNSFCLFDGQGTLANMSSEASNQIHEASGTFQMIPPAQMKDSRNLEVVNESLELDMECLLGPTNPVQLSTISQEPSQSESSAAAPLASAGFEVFDGPASSGQTPSVCESTRKHVRNVNLENGSKAKEFRERMLENNIKDDCKKGNLARMGSVTSGGSVDKGDPTKKRRVERSRKMAEAKERNLSPAIPSDTQAILKRCDNLEKEVRSLKLNLSFMNRKDSEQTKQIEELQRQNEDLMEEKERLLEEIERIISESGKI